MDSRAETRLVFGGFLAMAAAIGIGRFVYTPILPAMLQDLGWTGSGAGLVASANSAGYLAGAIATTRPMSPQFHIRWLAAALGLSVITTASMALPAGLLYYMGLRFAGGVASAFVIVLASALVLSRLPAGNNKSAIHFAGVGAGIFVSAAAVALVRSAGGGWQSMWLITAVLAALAAAGAFLLIEDGPRDHTQEAVEAAPQPDKPHAGLLVAYGLFGFGYVITATFIVALVRQTPALYASESWVWLLFGAAAIPSAPLWSRIGARIGLIPAFVLACVLEAGGVIASVEWSTPLGILFSALITGGTFMGITALGLMAAQQLSHAKSQRTAGIMTVSFAAGQTAGPAVAGFLFDALGSFRAASLTAAAALLLAAALAQRPAQGRAHS